MSDQFKAERRVRLPTPTLLEEAIAYLHDRRRQFDLAAAVEAREMQYQQLYQEKIAQRQAYEDTLEQREADYDMNLAALRRQVEEAQTEIRELRAVLANDPGENAVLLRAIDYWRREYARVDEMRVRLAIELNEARSS